MPERPLDTAEVEALLTDLAGGLAWPALPDAVAAARNRLVAGERAHARPLRPRLVWLVAAAVVLVAVLLALPGPRQAVADLFGLGGVQVRHVPTTVPASSVLDLGAPVTLDQALAQVPFDVYVPSALGPPVEVFLDTVGGRQVLSLTYGPGEGLPPAAGTGLGLLISEFAGTVEPFVDKMVHSSEQAHRVTIDGRPALWIEGPHLLFFGLGGPDDVGSIEPRLAANTLVVTRGTTTVRLEGEFDQATAIELAQSLVPAG